MGGTFTLAAAYPQALESLRSQRIDFLRQCRAAGAGDRPRVIVEARDCLFAALLRDIFPAWYGTPWAFEGVHLQASESSRRQE
jgi:hypothetical protein